MIINYSNYLAEFKSEDIRLILTGLQDYFTIGFEIEIETDKERVKSLKDVPRYESVMMYPSRQNRKMMEDFKSCFPTFWEKYEDRISFHDDETIVYGIEIVNSVPHGMKDFPTETARPFDNIKEAIEYIDTFFMDYEDQDHWFFSHRTSIHINIGTYDKTPFNLVKGILMISDQEKEGFVFKGIENRLTTYCSSMKWKLLDALKKGKSYKLLNSNNVKDIEWELSKYIYDIYDFYGGVKAKMAGAKLFGMIPKTRRDGTYMEFRYMGGDELTSEIMENKIIYFCYIVYLMSSEYRNKEYVRKLLGFINKLRTEE